MNDTIRLGIIGNSGQVRQHYVRLLCDQARLPCRVEIGWVSDCLCGQDGLNYNKCPFRASEKPDGLHLNFSAAKARACQEDCPNRIPWSTHRDEQSVDAVLVSLPNALHAGPAKAFLERGLAVALDKPPVITADEARDLVALAEAKQVPLSTLAQRRFEDVYRRMASKIPQMGKIQLINVLFVHGWTPRRPDWRSKKSLAGGGVLMDSVFHSLDVLLWLLRQSDNTIKPTAVHGFWELQDPNDVDTVELRIIVGVRFNTGCLLNITAASTALAPQSVDENIKIFGSDGVLRYQRDVISRTSMASGRLTFQSIHEPQLEEILMPDGQGQALRDAPLADFLECLHKPGQQPKSPVRDSIEVLEIIEKAYVSAQQGGISVPIA